MRSRGRMALLGAVLLSGALTGPIASAQSVPLPLPAPQPKTFLPLPFIGAPAVTSRAAVPAGKPRKVAQMTGTAAGPGAKPPAATNSRPGAAAAPETTQRGLVEREISSRSAPTAAGRRAASICRSRGAYDSNTIRRTRSS